jgi:hypothetical protein
MLRIRNTLTASRSIVLRPYLPSGPPHPNRRRKKARKQQREKTRCDFSTPNQPITPCPPRRRHFAPPTSANRSKTANDRGRERVTKSRGATQRTGSAPPPVLRLRLRRRFWFRSRGTERDREGQRGTKGGRGKEGPVPRNPIGRWTRAPLFGLRVEQRRGLGGWWMVPRRAGSCASRSMYSVLRTRIPYDYGVLQKGWWWWWWWCARE